MNQEDFADPLGTWNQRFAGEEYVFGTEPNEYLRRHAEVWAPPARVLCVADGEGRNSVWLARQGLSVVAFDLSPVGVEKARSLARQAGVDVEFHASTCGEWDWRSDSYDGIAAIFVQFADPPARARMFANFVRALRPGGTLVLQGYTLRQLEYGTGGPRIASHLYTQDLLRDAFAAFEILELREYDDELAEGSRHCGRSALLGLVARKPPSCC